jgi:hypothetical protein
MHWNQISHRKWWSIDNCFTIKYFIYIYDENKFTTIWLIVSVKCVAAMSLCMIVLIVTRKRGDGRYYFALWQTNNNTHNNLLLSESAVNCLFYRRRHRIFLLFHNTAINLSAMASGTGGFVIIGENTNDYNGYHPSHHRWHRLRWKLSGHSNQLYSHR